MGVEYKGGCAIIGADPNDPIVIPLGESFVWTHNAGQIPLKVEVYDASPRTIMPADGTVISVFVSDVDVEVDNANGGGDISVFLIVTWSLPSINVIANLPPTAGVVS